MATIPLRRIRSTAPLTILLAVAGASLGLPRTAEGTAIALSDIVFGDLTIAPESGTLEFLDLSGDGNPDPWTLTVFASASNSLGESAAGGFSISGPGTAGIQATVTYASGAGAATDPPPPPPALDVSAGAASVANIPGCDEIQALSAGRGAVSNTFMIIGGTGEVEVDFGAAISGMLEVFTDHCGLLAATEVFFGLELDGASLLSFHLPLAIGPNDHRIVPFAGQLETTRVLLFNTPYFLHIEVDSESEAITVPEPATVTLLVIGLALFVVRRVPFILNRRGQS
jgi:hypothetical protein